MTNKDLERLEEFFDDNDMTWDEYASLKVKLEEELEKAKKYDDLMKANSEIIQNNISHTQILQENKQLKEQLHQSKVLDNAHETYEDVIGDLMTKDQKEINNLKQKLEKIGKLPKYNFVNESDSWIKETQLKDILESKE